MEKSPNTNPRSDRHKQRRAKNNPFASASSNEAIGPDYLFPCQLELFRYFCVADFIVVEVNNIDLGAMFHLKLTKFMQMRFPFAILGKIVGNSPGEKNMSGIAAIHHPLRHIDAYSSNVALIIYIGDLIHRAAVNPHPQLQLWVLTQLATNLERTTDRHIHGGEEGQHYSVAS